MTVLVRDRATLRQVLAGPRSVVMTMGALHEGHARLMDAAREELDGQVVVTVFVNPMQFGPHEDFERYPRSLDADLEICESRGVDIVFAPTVSEIYPTPQVVTVQPGPLGEVLEGAIRPGHFAGVATVVTKLLHATAADVALFGEKDYQQLTVIRRLVDDLQFTGSAGSPVRVVGVATVRESDGLAMSSRNRYLSTAERQQAARIPEALGAGVACALAGADADAVVAAVREHLTGMDVEYVVLTDLDMGPAPRSGPARLLLAVRVGTTRLLDNMSVHLDPQGLTP